MRPAASTPPTFGMVTSSRTTSGLQLAGQLDGLLAVGGLADDVEALVGQRASQALPQQPVVVGQQHPDRHA